jgi:fluoroacetyl-CoA thioesterase
MQINLAPGSEYRTRVVVGQECTIHFMGDALRVYSTPAMILDVEEACKDFLREHLGDDSSSVGADVEMNHLGPTLVGMLVEIAVTVTAVDGRRVSFEAEMRDFLDVVGKAKQRFAEQSRDSATHEESPACSPA